MGGFAKDSSNDAELPFGTNPSKLLGDVIQVRGVAQPG